MKQLTNKELFKDMDQTIAKELFEETTYPWEVLALIGDFILKTGPELPEEEFNRIGDDVWIAKSAVIARTAEKMCIRDRAWTTADIYPTEVRSTCQGNITTACLTVSMTRDSSTMMRCSA